MTELVPPESFARDLAEIIDKAIDNAVDPLKSKIKALDEHITRLMLLSAKVAELQDRPELRYAGTWADHKDFAPGSLVSHQGGLWYCHERTKDRPGQSKNYQLVVKSGRSPT